MIIQALLTHDEAEAPAKPVKAEGLSHEKKDLHNIFSELMLYESLLRVRFQ